MICIRANNDSSRNDSDEDDDAGSIDFDIDDCDDGEDNGLEIEDELSEDDGEVDGRDPSMSMDDNVEIMSSSTTAAPSLPPDASEGKRLITTITGYGSASETSSKIVYYVIHIEQKGAKWTVYRRYRQFKALSDSLVRSGVQIDCQLPPKQMFGSSSVEFLEKRKKGLALWLTELCKSFAMETFNHVASSSVMSFFTSEANIKPKGFSIDGGHDVIPVKRTRRRRCKISVHDFEMIKMIGKGSFGEVMLVRKKDTKSLYAMKILDKRNIIRRNQVEHTITERRVLGRTKHPFIVTLHFAFQTGKKLYFVLDYCSGGELFFHLGRCGRLRESLACFYSAEITLALSHLHSVGIMYRDLKPENILLDKDGHVKLADFGLSKEGIPNGVSGTGSFCGTAEYLAPEILNRTGHGTGVDWWALGMVLYEMLTGMPPWYTKERDVLFERVCRAPLDFPSHVSKPARVIISGLLIRDVARRLGVRGKGAQEVMEQEFYSHIDWKALLERRLAPPFRPRRDIGSLDASNFDKVFTKMPVVQPTGPSSVAESGNFPDFSFQGHYMRHYRTRFRSTGGTVIGTPTTPPLPRYNRGGNMSSRS